MAASIDNGSAPFRLAVQQYIPELCTSLSVGPDFLCELRSTSVLSEEDTERMQLCGTKKAQRMFLVDHVLDNCVIHGDGAANCKFFSNFLEGMRKSSQGHLVDKFKTYFANTGVRSSALDVQMGIISEQEEAKRERQRLMRDKEEQRERDVRARAVRYRENYPKNKKEMKKICGHTSCLPPTDCAYTNFECKAFVEMFTQKYMANKGEGGELLSSHLCEANTIAVRVGIREYINHCVARNRSEVANHLRALCGCHAFWDKLVAANVVTDTVRESIQVNGKTTSGMASLLIDHLRKRTAKDYWSFLEAVKERKEDQFLIDFFSALKETALMF